MAKHPEKPLRFFAKTANGDFHEFKCKDEEDRKTWITLLVKRVRDERQDESNNESLSATTTAPLLPDSEELSPLQKAMFQRFLQYQTDGGTDLGWTKAGMFAQFPEDAHLLRFLLAAVQTEEQATRKASSGKDEQAEQRKSIAGNGSSTSTGEIVDADDPHKSIEPMQAPPVPVVEHALKRGQNWTKMSASGIKVNQGSESRGKRAPTLSGALRYALGRDPRTSGSLAKDTKDNAYEFNVVEAASPPRGQSPKRIRSLRSRSRGAPVIVGEPREPKEPKEPNEPNGAAQEAAPSEQRRSLQPPKNRVSLNVFDSDCDSEVSSGSETDGGFSFSPASSPRSGALSDSAGEFSQLPNRSKRLTSGGKSPPQLPRHPGRAPAPVIINRSAVKEEKGRTAKQTARTARSSQRIRSADDPHAVQADEHDWTRNMGFAEIKGLLCALESSEDSDRALALRALWVVCLRMEEAEEAKEAREMVSGAKTRALSPERVAGRVTRAFNILTWNFIATQNHRLRPRRTGSPLEAAGER